MARYRYADERRRDEEIGRLLIAFIFHAWHGDGYAHVECNARVHQIVVEPIHAAVLAGTPGLYVTSPRGFTYHAHERLDFESRVEWAVAACGATIGSPSTPPNYSMTPPFGRPPCLRCVDRGAFGPEVTQMTRTAAAEWNRQAPPALLVALLMHAWHGYGYVHNRFRFEVTIVPIGAPR